MSEKAYRQFSHLPRPKAKGNAERRPGFSLIEAIIALAAGGVLFGSIIALSLAVQGQALPRAPVLFTSTFGTHLYEPVPSPAQFQNAVDIIRQIEELRLQASGIYLLGGEGMNPTSTVIPTPQGPLQAGVVPVTISALSAPFFPRHSLDVAAAAALSGLNFEADWGQGDYTVLFLSGVNTVMAVLQSRRYAVFHDEQNRVLYEVVLDTQPGVARNTTFGPSQNRFSYRIELTPLEDASWGIAPGARHFWFRWDPDWGRQEPAPSLVVLPDPILMAGDQAVTELQPLSRFVLFLRPHG